MGYIQSKLILKALEHDDRLEKMSYSVRDRIVQKLMVEAEYAIREAVVYERMKGLATGNETDIDDY